MTVELIMYVLLIHFLGDFALQTQEQALKKSSEDKFLLYHVAIYSVIWLLASYIILGWFRALIFASVTFCTHYAIDYVTSRINKKFFAQENWHDGFVGIGADQLLHYLQLFFTLKILLEYGTE